MRSGHESVNLLIWLQVIADIVVNLFQETAIDLAFVPFGPRDEALLAEELPPPVFAGNIL